MESSSSRRAADAQKQAELKRKIAELQTQLKELPDEESPTREETTASVVVAPATPSPRKKRKVDHGPSIASTIKPLRLPQAAQKPLKQKLTHAPPHAKDEETTPATSNLIAHLRTLSTKTPSHEPIARSNGFQEKPVDHLKSKTSDPIPSRDSELAVIENLEPGPVEHKPLVDDPNFEKIEPNSGIRLSARSLSHDDVQDHLTGRYFLPPSLLYSVARLTPDKQAYDIPVEGDWVTIGVVAERGDIRFTNPGTNGTKEDDDDDTKNGKGKTGKPANSSKCGKRNDPGSQNAVSLEGDEGVNEQYNKRRSKKYANIRLVDLGNRSRTSASNSSTSRGSLQGDAQLTLLLFESDSYDMVTDDLTGKTRKAWKGGSGGAFEECYTKLREGAVIALLNPKVLRPFQNMKNPSSSHVLALTPPSASAIAIIGRARDLGRCTVRKRDGKLCSAWVDKRVTAGSSSTGDVCEYHLQSAVQRARAGRAEFSVGTSGMTTTAKKQRTTTDFDPARKWGLQPSSGTATIGGDTMYIIGGYVASSSNRPQGALAPGRAAETIGREGQARARRRAEEHESESVLKELLSRERASGLGGSAAEVVKTARNLVLANRAQNNVDTTKEQENKSRSTSSQMKGKGKARESASMNNADDGNTKPKRSINSNTSSTLGDEEERPKRSYSAEIVKRLGFDPASLSVKIGGRAQGQNANKKSVVLFPNRALTGTIHLGPPPGKKVRSCVVTTTTTQQRARDDEGGEVDSSKMTSQDVEESESELEFGSD